MNHRIVQIPAVECPRCGYDLRGAMERWWDSCPLEGVCSECGLVHLWRDVLNPKFGLPKWCIEFSRGNRRLFTSMFSTLAMTLKPWRFWSELRMSHPLRPGRFILLAIMILAVGYLLFALSVGSGAAFGHSTAATPPNLFGRIVAFMHGAALPWSTLDPVTKIAPKSITEKLSFDLHVHAARAIRSGQGFDAIDLRWSRSLATFQAVAIILIAPVGFLALPVSRRLAKTRWRHVIRISVYGMVWLLVPLTVEYWLQMHVIVPGTYVRDAPWVMLASVYVILSIWWGVAASQYLRMPHGWLVGPAVVVLAWLGQWTLLMAIDLALDA